MKIGSVFITGTNRGIGLELVRQLANLEDAPDFIFATYRNSSGIENLKSIQDKSVKTRVVLIKMDVTDQEEIHLATQIVEEYVGEKGLNLLINNAGVAKVMPFADVTPENMEEHFRVNTVSPVMIFQAMLPLLEKAANNNATAGINVSRAAVLNITSMVGSIFNTGQLFLEDIIGFGYKTSKAALNMAMRVASVQLKDKGILVVCMCPGWVKTDMGTEFGEITVDVSASDMIRTIGQLDETSHGSFLDRLGNRYPF